MIDWQGAGWYAYRPFRTRGGAERGVWLRLCGVFYSQDEVQEMARALGYAQVKRLRNRYEAERFQKEGVK